VFRDVQEKVLKLNIFNNQTKKDNHIYELHYNIMLYNIPNTNNIIIMYLNNIYIKYIKCHYQPI